MTIPWAGVFPAVTTQLHEDLTVDLANTQRVVDDLIRDGVNGIIALGTVGENNSLESHEKLAVLKAVVEVVHGRVPVLTGVSEYDTRRAIRYTQAAEVAGADGLMLLPPMVYVPKRHELIAHFAGVARATALPIMLYNNPPAYRTMIDAETARAMAAHADQLWDGRQGSQQARSISAVQQHAPRRQQAAPQRRRSPSTGQRGRAATPHAAGLCFYHGRFAEKAHRCEQPCTWTGNAPAAGSN